MPELPLLNIAEINNYGVANRHPLADDAEAQVAQFAAKFGIKTRFFDAYNTLFPYLHPDGDFERLVLAGKVYAVLWFLDDLWDGSLAVDDVSHLGLTDQQALDEMLSGIFHILATVTLPKNPNNIHYALHHVVEHLDDLANEQWLSTLLATIRESIQTSTLHDIQARSHSVLENYFYHRDRDGGGIYSCLLMEFTKNVYLPTTTRNHAAVSRMRQLSYRIGGIGNDLVSYPKESALNNTRFNLIAILMNAYHLDLADAIMQSIIIHNQLVADFKFALQQVPRLTSLFGDALQDYTTGLEEIISGTWYWELNSARYTHSQALFYELRQRTLGMVNH